MDYKIIALDIDGTLTNSQKEITPRTRYAIIDAQKIGKKVVIASGRHPMGIQSIARDLLLDRYEGYIMAFNGGKILDCTTGQTIVSKDFPKEYLSDILGVLKESNLSVHTYDDKKIITGGTLNDYSNVERDILKMEMVVVEDFAANIPEKSINFYFRGNLPKLINITKFLQNATTVCLMCIRAHRTSSRLCRLA